MITKAGMPSRKVIVGVTSYGRSFRMAQAGCTGPMCTFTGTNKISNASPGRCTGTFRPGCGMYFRNKQTNTNAQALVATSRTRRFRRLFEPTPAPAPGLKTRPTTLFTTIPTGLPTCPRPTRRAASLISPRPWVAARTGRLTCSPSTGTRRPPIAQTLSTLCCLCTIRKRSSASRLETWFSRRSGWHLTRSSRFLPIPPLSKSAPRSARPLSSRQRPSPLLWHRLRRERFNNPTSRSKLGRQAASSLLPVSPSLAQLIPSPMETESLLPER